MSTFTLPWAVRAPLARVAWMLVALLLALAGAARAQDDPPGRVGRVADVQGTVWWYDIDEGRWTEAERNRPLTQGDRISTAAASRAQLEVGSTVLRLGPASELEVLRLDDDRMAFQLHSGALALRVRTREIAGEIELVTAEARLHPQRAGHYRVDRIDDATHAGSWRGTLRIDDRDGFEIETGRMVELWREGSSRELRHAWSTPHDDDDFAAWVLAADQREERTAATRHVSPEMTGADDLDRHGRWDRHPEYGALWFPIEVRPGWAPYRYGSWAWVRPWGWTWVDEAPWGFAPFHYGRWVHWHGRWGWWPGSYVARPVYAPALVAWVGGSHWGVSINIGGPAIGWVPLAPHERYAPWYRVTPVYVDRVNRRPPGGRKPVPRLPGAAVRYDNTAAPGGVTVVPRDALHRRQPVPRVIIDAQGPSRPGGRGRDGDARDGRDGPGRQWVGAAPPEREVRPRRDARDARDPAQPREGRRGGPAPGTPAELRPPLHRLPPGESLAPPPSEGDRIGPPPPVPRSDPPPATDRRPDPPPRTDRRRDEPPAAERRADPPPEAGGRRPDPPPAGDRRREGPRADRPSFGPAQRDRRGGPEAIVGPRRGDIRAPARGDGVAAPQRPQRPAVQAPALQQSAQPPMRPVPRPVAAPPVVASPPPVIASPPPARSARPPMGWARPSAPAAPTTAAPMPPAAVRPTPAAMAPAPVAAPAMQPPERGGDRRGGAEGRGAGARQRER